MTKTQRITKYLAVSSSSVFVLLAPLLLFADTIWYRGVVSLVCGASLVLLYSALRTAEKAGWLTDDDALTLICIWFVAMIGNGLGSLGLYRTIFYYDLFLHFALPLIGAEFFYILFRGYSRHAKIPFTRITASKSILSASAIIIALIIGWEVYEHYSDVWFGTLMSWQYGDPTDTQSDIIAGLCGVAVVALAEWTNAYRATKNTSK